MYNVRLINKFVSFIRDNDGIADKQLIAKKVQKKFNLVLDRALYYCEDFAVRFSLSRTKRMGNTVLSLAALHCYDDRPVFVCVVTQSKNYLMLINSTFIKKVSHSSQNLRVDNIRGSINGSDIMLDFEGIENVPENFQELFAEHEEFTFEENLERLVEATNSIAGRIQRFDVGEKEKTIIFEAVNRANNFVASDDYIDLQSDLNRRANKVKGEIAIAATYIKNVNLRGRVIEYLVTNNSSDIKKELVNALRKGEKLPLIKTLNGLGDYCKDYTNFSTKTDIKTKVMYLNSNPKAYNIDKLLEFLATKNSVYMIYLLGIDEKDNIISRLISVFDERIVDTTRILKHWAGRNSRGVTQFDGYVLKNILKSNDKTKISTNYAKEFLNKLIRLD